MKWRNVGRGFLIGTSDLVPGVSGGTVALLLGIYDELLASLGGLLSRRWREHVNFLLPLVVGMAAAMLSLSRVMNWLLTYHPVPTKFLFFGLVLGLIPRLGRTVQQGNTLGPGHAAAFLLATAVVAATAFVRPADGQAVGDGLALADAALLFGAGALASTTMLLPGVSGSFVLLLLGVYPTAIHALSTFDVPLLFVIGSGVGVGFIAGSRLIRGILHRWPDVTMAAIVGLLFGSLFVLWPGRPDGGVLHYVLSAAALVLGVALTRWLGPRTDG